MARQRFREIKRSKHKVTEETSVKPTYPYARASIKVKAFLTDSFMLMMPILYIVVYMLMDGREGFAAQKMLGWIYIFIPLIAVQTLFMIKTAQTPGYRAYDLEIIDTQTAKKPTPFIILFRNLCALLSFFSLFGWMLMFFRKDAKTLHDLLSRTAIIKKS